MKTHHSTPGESEQFLAEIMLLGTDEAHRATHGKLTPYKAARVEEAIRWLQERLPRHFPSDGSRPIPWDDRLLKQLRVQYPREVVGRLNVLRIAASILKWRQRRAYLLSVSIDPQCYGVEMEPIGWMVREHAAYARRVLRGYNAGSAR